MSHRAWKNPILVICDVLVYSVHVSFSLEKLIFTRPKVFQEEVFIHSCNVSCAAIGQKLLVCIK